MRDHLRTGALALLLLAAPALAAEEAKKKPAWTEDQLKLESAACTEALVQGAWERTKRAQNADPKMEMTPDIRKQLAPQIEQMAKVCDCAVREAAKKFNAEDSNKPEFQQFAIETVTSGKCKPAAK